jgi:hypothetical protein
MKQADPVLSPAESLQLIAGVMAGTKPSVRSWKFVFLLWGWLIMIASLLFFLLKEFTDFSAYFLPFPVLVATGIALTIRHFRKNRYSSEGYADHYVKQLWTILGIAFMVVVLVSLVRQVPPFTYTMVIGGIGTLLTGRLIRFRPLVAGGTLFLAMAVGSVFTPDAWKPLIQAAAVFTGYLLPGYLLRDQKDEHVQ